MDPFGDDNDDWADFAEATPTAAQEPVTAPVVSESIVKDDPDEDDWNGFEDATPVSSSVEPTIPIMSDPFSDHVLAENDSAALKEANIEVKTSVVDQTSVNEDPFDEFSSPVAAAPSAVEVSSVESLEADPFEEFVSSPQEVSSIPATVECVPTAVADDDPFAGLENHSTSQVDAPVENSETVSTVPQSEPETESDPKPEPVVLTSNVVEESLSTITSVVPESSVVTAASESDDPFAALSTPHSSVAAAPAAATAGVIELESPQASAAAAAPSFVSSLDVTPTTAPTSHQHWSDETSSATTTGTVVAEAASVTPTIAEEPSVPEIPVNFGANESLDDPFAGLDHADPVVPEVAAVAAAPEPVSEVESSPVVEEEPAVVEPSVQPSIEPTIDSDLLSGESSASASTITVSTAAAPVAAGEVDPFEELVSPSSSAVESVPAAASVTESEPTAAAAAAAAAVEEEPVAASSAEDIADTPVNPVADVSSAAVDSPPEAGAAVSQEVEEDPFAELAASPAPVVETVQPVAEEPVGAQVAVEAAEATNSPASADVELTVEPAAVEPAAIEPAAVEPAAVEPAVVEPAAVEPAAVEPAAVEPAAVEPAVVEPADDEPAAVEPAVVEPADDEPAAVEPAVVEPAAAEPAVVEPAVVEPAAAEPAVVEPAAVEPAVVEPAAVEPAVVEPAAEEDPFDDVFVSAEPAVASSSVAVETPDTVVEPSMSSAAPSTAVAAEDEEEDPFEDAFVSAPPAESVAVSADVTSEPEVSPQPVVETPGEAADAFGGEDDWDDFEGPSTASNTVPTTPAVYPEPAVVESAHTESVEPTSTTAAIPSQEAADVFGGEDGDDEWDAFEEAPSTPSVAAAAAAVAAAPVTVAAAPVTASASTEVDAFGDDGGEDDWDAFEAAPSSSTTPTTAAPVTATAAAVPALSIQKPETLLAPPAQQQQRSTAFIGAAATSTASVPSSVVSSGAAASLTNFFAPSVQLVVNSGIAPHVSSQISDEVNAVKAALNSSTFSANHQLAYRTMRSMSAGIFSNPVISGTCTVTSTAALTVDMKALNEMCASECVAAADAFAPSPADWTSETLHSTLLASLPEDALPVEQLRRVQLKRIMASTEYRNRAYAQAVKQSLKKSRASPAAASGNTRRASHNVTLDGSAATAIAAESTSSSSNNKRNSFSSSNTGSTVASSGKASVAASTVSGPSSANRSMSNSPLRPPAKADSLMSFDNAFHDDEPSSSSSHGATASKPAGFPTSIAGSSAHGSFDNDNEQEEDDFGDAEFISADNSPKSSSGGGGGGGFNAPQQSAAAQHQQAAKPATPVKSSWFGSSAKPAAAAAAAAPPSGVTSVKDAKPPMIPKDSSSNSKAVASASGTSDKYVIDKDQYSAAAYNFLVGLPDLSFILNTTPTVPNK